MTLLVSFGRGPDTLNESVKKLSPKTPLVSQFIST